MGAENIQKEMEAFEASIRNLSDGVSRASNLWKDAKYGELSAAVGRVASQSRDVMLSAERSLKWISKFNEIAAERY